MISDLLERERALDPSQSFIVQAPAGSGKTGLLIQRHLRLLSIVERPESIVAMTFTRKAAGEMRERVQRALLEAAEDLPVTDAYQQRTRKLAMAALAQDREKGWNLAADPSRLQIQTIDSLCTTLTRQSPVSSGFGGGGQIIEDARELYGEAARRALRSLVNGGEDDRQLLTRISLHFDSSLALAERQIASMVERRDQWFHFADTQGEPLVADFCTLLDRANQSLQDVFREVGAIDFIELTRAAIKALGTPEHPSDLLYSLDYRIEHLLVDEFQDTSYHQYDFIDRLIGQWSHGDGRTVFLVGDPLQSIYRFRGAEVQLFLDTLKRGSLGSVHLERIALQTNFRSTPDILSWVQKMFEPIMTDEGAGSIKFCRSSAARAAGNPSPGLITLVDDTACEEEADRLVPIVEKARAKGSVAILVRNRSHLAKILPSLRAATIPYEAVEIDELEAEQHVIDLLSLTRAISHIGNRTAWLACLRAPWCGLTLSDLAALTESEPDTPILDLLSDPGKISQLPPSARKRAVRFQEIAAEAVARYGRTNLSELVEQTWISLGGPAVLNQDHQAEDARTFFALLAELEEGAFLRDFASLSRRLEWLYAKPATGENYVQVMTIHRAKGLEFRTVILPQLAGTGGGYDRDLLVGAETADSDGSTEFTVYARPKKGAEDANYSEVARANDDKQLQELKRLFYVGCTRAIDELYLFGNVDRKLRGGGFKKVNARSFLGLIWNSVQDEFEAAARRMLPKTGSTNGVERHGTILRRLPESWRLPVLERSVVWQPEYQRTVASSRKTTYEWVGDTSRHVGTVVHDLLKRVAREGPAAWSESRLEKLLPLVQSELLRLGVPRSEEVKALAQVFRALKNTLGSKRGKWILAPHSDAHSEWPVTGLIQDQLISGTVDRVFRDESGCVWIIDYKTSEHLGGKLEAFLREEQRRYRMQLENYAVLLSRLFKGPFRLGLYFPLLDAWREWEFGARALPAEQLLLYTEE